MLRKLAVGLFLMVVLSPTSPATAARGAPRILYSSDWLGHMELFGVRPDGRGAVAQLTRGADPRCRDRLFACGFASALPSPDGRWILYRGTWPKQYFPSGAGPSLWVAAADGSRARRLLPPGDSLTASGGLAGTPAWSGDSKRIAYVTGKSVHVVRLNGSGDRVVAEGLTGDVAWLRGGRSLLVLSKGDLYLLRGGTTTMLAADAGCRLGLSPDRRWAATTCSGFAGRIRLVSVTGDKPTPRIIGDGVDAAWAPDSKRLAFQGPGGISVYDLRTRRTRVLSRDGAISQPREEDSSGLGLAWAPDGRSIAYIVGTIGDRAVRSGDLRVVTLTGRVRTIVAASKAYGGRIYSLAWTRPPATLRYVPATPASAEPKSILAGGPIERLATDGPRVAFSACQTVRTWTPSTGALSGTSGACFDRDRYAIYEVVLSGDQLGYAEMEGCNSIRQQLRLGSLDSTPPGSVIATGHGACASPFAAVGHFIGGGDLLVFSNWSESVQGFYPNQRFRTTAQSLIRVDGSACPCPVIATSPGPLVPADVDAGRVLVYGDNATLVLDRTGHTLLSVPVSPLAAQLTGNDLILALRGELRDYDATNGALLRSWPLPDVDTGGACSLHCGADPSCWVYCRANTLALQDAAGGLVAYVLDEKVHVLRFADGADATVGGGTIARFMDEGLVYADGSRLHLVPFAKLPLRGF